MAVPTDVADELQCKALVDKTVAEFERVDLLVNNVFVLADDLDLDGRENIVLSSGKYVETCYPCGSSGLWMLKARPAAIKSAVKAAANLDAITAGVSVESNSTPTSADVIPPVGIIS